MRLSIGMLAGLALSGVTAGAAQATAFTDEAAWRAAGLNVYALETWDTAATPTYGDVGAMPSLGIRFLPLDDGTQPTVQPYAQTGGVVRSGPNNLLNDRDYSLPARGPLNIVPLNSGDYFFGLGMWNVGGDDTLTLTFFDVDDNVIESVTSAASFGFFGLVSTTQGAVRAQVAFAGGNEYSPTDDFQTAVRGTFVPTDPGGVVPEPETWALMIAGFGFAGAALRRRRGLSAA